MINLNENTQGRGGISGRNYRNLSFSSFVSLGCSIYIYTPPPPVWVSRMDSEIVESQNVVFTFTTESGLIFIPGKIQAVVARRDNEFTEKKQNYTKIRRGIVTLYDMYGMRLQQDDSQFPSYRTNPNTKVQHSKTAASKGSPPPPRSLGRLLP